MPIEPSSHHIKNILVLVLVVCVIGGVLFFAQKQKKNQTLEQVVVPAVEEQVEEVPEATATEPEPARVPETTQSQIDAIARKVETGAITIEEAQKQVNQLLGITE